MPAISAARASHPSSLLFGLGVFAISSTKMTLPTSPRARASISGSLTQRVEGRRGSRRATETRAASISACLRQPNITRRKHAHAYRLRCVTTLRLNDAFERHLPHERRRRAATTIHAPRRELPAPAVRVASWPTHARRTPRGTRTSRWIASIAWPLLAALWACGRAQYSASATQHHSVDGGVTDRDRRLGRARYLSDSTSFFKVHLQIILHHRQVLSSNSPHSVASSRE